MAFVTHLDEKSIKSSYKEATTQVRVAWDKLKVFNARLNEELGKARRENRCPKFEKVEDLMSIVWVEGELSKVWTRLISLESTIDKRETPVNIKKMAEEHKRRLLSALTIFFRGYINYYSGVMFGLGERLGAIFKRRQEIAARLEAQRMGAYMTRLNGLTINMKDNVLFRYMYDNVREIHELYDRLRNQQDNTTNGIRRDFLGNSG